MNDNIYAASLENYAKRRKQFATMLITFPASALCTAGIRKACTAVQCSAQWDFIVFEIEGDLLVGTASGSAVVGTSLPRDGPVASNVATLPSINSVLLNLGDSNTGWTDTHSPFGLVCGRPGWPKPLPVPQLIGRSTPILAELDNQSNANSATGVSVYGYILLRGMRVWA